MTPNSHRLRRHGLGALCVAAGTVLGGAAMASATTEPVSSEPEGTAAEGSAPADLDALIAAANEEGKLNLIALPATWANYQGIIASFNEKYPDIVTEVQDPEASSAQEIVAVQTQAGSDTMPDALDVSPAIAL